MTAYVEPRKGEPGCWNFFCECGWEDWRRGCTRVVNDSEPNFRCERPIVDATDVPCKYQWKLAPLIEEWKVRRAKEEATEYLRTLEQKRADALAVLGMTAADLEDDTEEETK